MNTIQLFKQSFQGTGFEPIGRITEAQLQFLIANFEEEFLEDQDYYLDRDTIDFLKELGADNELVKIFEHAIAGLGPEEGIDVVYKR